MKSFSLLIKPVSADCNLNCQYCFYLDHRRFYPETKKHRMSDEVLDKMISSFMATNQTQYAFGWQGGEPTLMGFEFFQRVTELQKKYGASGASVANGLQTNATLIDDKIAEHFRKYNFLLGVSLDGPEEIHDYYRKKANGSGSHAETIKGIEVLKRHNVEFNILILVSKTNVAKAKEVYHYLLANGFLYHQYIPCVEFDSSGNPLPYTISGEEWGDFLCGIFDEWSRSDTRKVSIRLFDSILTYFVDNVRNICHLGRNCCQYFVVEYNGDVYPCDFFVCKDLKLGNIKENNWDLLMTSKIYKNFGGQKKQWNKICGQCPYLHICSGDCLKHRLFGENANPRTLSWLCTGWKKFYGHSISGFKKLAEQIKKERALASFQMRPDIADPSFSNIGRNAPCPCGSGKKYKKCCLNKA